MVSAALHLIPYALVASLSPVGLAATLAVLRSGRLKALGFGVGFVAGQLAACALLLAIGVATVPQRAGGHPTLRGVLDLALGLTLLWLAALVRRRPPGARHSNGRTQALLDRLGRLHVATAAVAGVLLGIGGPKRLVLTALAAAYIAATGIEGTQEVELVVWYVALATVLVWAPVVAFVFVGDRVVQAMDASLRWLAAHQRRVMVDGLLVLGVLLLVDAVITFA